MLEIFVYDGRSQCSEPILGVLWWQESACKRAMFGEDLSDDIVPRAINPVHYAGFVITRGHVERKQNARDMAQILRYDVFHRQSYPDGTTAMF